MTEQVGPAPTDAPLETGVGIIDPLADIPGHNPSGGAGIGPPGDNSIPNPIPGAPRPNPPHSVSDIDSNPVIPHGPPGLQQPGSNTSTLDKGYNANLSFYHPKVGTLTTQYGINYVTWDYRLNTQHYSTYAGEVVQILSVAVDDIIIRGQIATYEQMETMFKYFARYMERATQGSGNTSNGQGDGNAYNEEPMKLTYPTRGWEFNIQPKGMLGFRYGREIVAPEWEMTAAVYDINPSIEKDLKTALAHSYLKVTDAAGTPNPTATALDESPLPLQGEIGFNPNNPFSNPFPQDGITGKADPSKETGPFKDFGTYYNTIVKGFATGDYHTVLDKFGSVPNLTPSKNTGTTNTSAKAK